MPYARRHRHAPATRRHLFETSDAIDVLEII